MSATPPESPDRGKTFVLVLTLINTVLAALITALQVDASIRSDQSLRASQVYAVQASGELVRYGVQTDYDLNTLTILTTNTQESLMAQYSALQRQGANDQQGSDALTLMGLVAQARADRAKSLSVLMTNPAYAPPTGQVLPNMSAYLADLSASANALVKQQNDASDAYHRWNSKSELVRDRPHRPCDGILFARCSPDGASRSAVDLRLFRHWRHGYRHPVVIAFVGFITAAISATIKRSLLTAPFYCCSSTTVVCWYPIFLSFSNE